MKASNKRDNAYWAKRLEKDGHGEILARVQSDGITMYQARGLAGYRKIGPETPAAKLSYHWTRASAAERKRFVTVHLLDVNRVLKEVAAGLKAVRDK